MTDRRQRLVLTGALTALVVAATASAATLGPAARRMPLAVAVPTLALLLCELVRQWRAPRGGDGEPTAAAEVAVFAWLGGLVAGVSVLGMLVGLPLFLAAFLRVRSQESWAVVVGMSVGVWGVLYGLLWYVLGIHMHHGVFSRWWA